MKFEAVTKYAKRKRCFWATPHTKQGLCYCVYECNILLTHMLGLLWAASSFSTNSSTASIGDEARSRPYNNDMVQITLLHDWGHKSEIKCSNMIYMI